MSRHLTKLGILEELETFLTDSEDFNGDFEEILLNFKSNSNPFAEDFERFSLFENSRNALLKYGIFKALHLISEYEIDNPDCEKTNLSNPVDIADKLHYVVAKNYLDGSPVFAYVIDVGVSGKWNDNNTKELISFIKKMKQLLVLSKNEALELEDELVKYESAELFKRMDMNFSEMNSNVFYDNLDKFWLKAQFYKESTVVNGCHIVID